MNFIKYDAFHIESDYRMKTKIIYVVLSTDDDIYLEQTWASAYSLKFYTSDAYIVILTDKKTNENIMGSGRRRILSVGDEYEATMAEKYLLIGGIAA